MRVSQRLVLLLFVGAVATGVMDARPEEEVFEKRENAAPPRWDWGFQATAISQAAPSFRSPYTGPRSFANSGSAAWSTTVTGTVYTGLSLWNGAWVSIQPEFSGGGGPGGGQGIGAYVNQDAVKAGSSVRQRPYIARAFLHQELPFGESAQEPPASSSEPSRDLDGFVADSNARFGTQKARRIEITAGKFSMADFFDANDVAGDVHHRLMNWALVNDGAWDYSADARGYTWGAVLGVFRDSLAFRVAVSAMPSVANGISFDTALAEAHAENAEISWAFDPDGKGSVRLLAWENHARMGSYREALASSTSSERPDITVSRRPGRTKRGLGLNLQRQFGEWGGFLRAGWSDGRNESFAYTEIDRTFSAGAAHGAALIGRPDDTLVLAGVASALSAEHRQYLEAGGIGFQVGDGRLRYGREQVIEANYNAQITGGVSLGADFQRVWNPGYNRDRGPISVFGIRLHLHP
ncbi:MAG: carbohydrate porin [Acidobacteriota bacterium]